MPPLAFSLVHSCLSNDHSTVVLASTHPCGTRSRKRQTGGTWPSRGEITAKGGGGGASDPVVADCTRKHRVRSMKNVSTPMRRSSYFRVTGSLYNQSLRGMMGVEHTCSLFPLIVGLLCFFRMGPYWPGHVSDA